MGKQISYYMEFETWVKLCEKALDLGFEIVHEDKKLGKVITGTDTDILTQDSGSRYYFHLPNAGGLIIKKDGFGNEILDHGYTACSNAVIETGFSGFDQRNKEIHSCRLFIQTGYYDEKGNFISRPDCIDKKYNSLVRFVKKIAPYTELTEMRTSLRDEDYLKEHEFKFKRYITPYCLDFVENKGYKAR